MIRLVILAVVVYLAWHYFGWRVAAGVAAGYVVLLFIINAASTVTRGINASAMRGSTNELMHRKLSDEEKAHYASSREHERTMIDHRAQFDPELRKPRDR
ncbi:MAG: hypothetical protein JO343_02530 [Candidatus Eremiobacteraeota bacterium]|nr:hypothetical protein [Candidatus Eremiobacteraeota bacterium]MBV8338801.1 hypothetical protein [Candidatus Eremiobacteraeota bacterium]MBV8668222.1 hypothetical protein [Candidatus Eremiobacteraeota bacterium]